MAKSSFFSKDNWAQSRGNLWKVLKKQFPKTLPLLFVKYAVFLLILILFFYPLNLSVFSHFKYVEITQICALVNLKVKAKVPFHESINHCKKNLLARSSILPT